jgi:protein required for attachment to host cells
MNYAHSQANVQTTPWLICLNAGQPPSLLLWALQHERSTFMKPTRTWILIADGARARILQNDGPGKGLQALEGRAWHGDHAATHELMTDRAGRAFSSTGPARSAIEPHSDPHRQLKRNFAHRLADALTEGWRDRAYDRLILVAAPSALGDLRAALSPEVRAKVVAEVPKDLTKTPDAAVVEHLSDVLAV